MFARIFSLFMTVILLVTATVSGIAWYSLRNQQIEARLEQLTGEAREIAYLASRVSSGFGYLRRIGETDALALLRWKANEVYNDYGAYILVVDRLGRVMDNMSAAYELDPDFAASLNGEEITGALRQVLSGQEISIRLDKDGEPTFTVGAPFIQDNIVLGAVFIRTKAQVVESGADDLIRDVILVALAALAVSALAVALVTRSLMKPLRRMTEASKKMADGDFTVRVEPGGPKEIRATGNAFNTMADRLDKIEAGRREFVANVSHELRSPITSIAGFVQGMEDGTIPQEEHAHYLHLVSSETGRLSKLIGDLLALSRLERDDATLNVTSFDICEMLRRAVIRRVNDLEAHALEVSCEFDSDNMFVCADSDRIEQVVINLLDNALKFTPDGGRIVLRVHMTDNLCKVTIADNGIGILEQDRDRIFERFFTSDRAHTSGKGTGLGLSICMRIMQMHGQTIVLDDTERGAAFTFTLEPSAEPENKNQHQEAEK